MDEKIPFWRDTRIITIAIQVIAVLAVLAVFFFLGSNLANNFRRLGLSFGFGFLFDAGRPASFRIGDSLIPYQSTDTYSRAILVGLLNSLRVMVSGIFLAALLGITIGIGRLSDNWLIRKLAAIYVEILRNTPLLLQLFFWYFAVFLKLPRIDNPSRFLNSIFLTNQGIYLPWPAGNLQTGLTLFFLGISAILAVIVWRRQTQALIQRGESGKFSQSLLICIAIFSVLAIFMGLDWQFPQHDSAIKRIQGGLSLSPEFATLLVGLTVYTAAFIAEVVRAGIQSVPRGQWEAAKALGLKPGLMMRLVIFPQALRVMIPPLTSEFLNLAKNSSLAVAIGFNDIYAVSNTIANQTGKAVEILAIVMSAYLIFNLIIAAAMNWFNRLVQIKER